MATTFTKIETGKTWTTGNVGKAADAWFVKTRSTEINAAWAAEAAANHAKSEKIVNTARLDVTDDGDYSVIETSQMTQKVTYTARVKLLVKAVTVARRASEPSAARIDSIMDGGYGSMGMLDAWN